MAAESLEACGLAALIAYSRVPDLWSNAFINAVLQGGVEPVPIGGEVSPLAEQVP